MGMVDGMSMRIAVLCHFPWRGGGSGAPRRTEALCKAYEAAGHTVQAVSLYRPDEKSRRITPADISLTPAHVRQLESDPWPSVHLALMRLVAADADLLKALRVSLESFRPDVVQFEFPYLYEPLTPVLAELSTRPAVVYSSHNVETAMNVAIARRESGAEDRAAEISRQLGRAEGALLAAADLVLAVSQQDAEAFRLTRPDAPVAVVPNGVDPRAVDDENVTHWRKQLAEAGVTSFALFVGSEWPPNAEGFFDMLGDDFSWVPEGSMIVVAGGTAADIAPRLAVGGAERAWLNSRRMSTSPRWSRSRR
jgi:glycosyltransferase involved in cell wall biosynthesis